MKMFRRLTICLTVALVKLPQRKNRARLASLFLCSMLAAAACSQQTSGTRTGEMTAEKAEHSAEAAASAETTPTISARCTGAEPFWSLRIADDALILQTPQHSGEMALVVPGRWKEAPTGSAHYWAADDGSSGLQINQEACIAPSGAGFDYTTDAAALLGIDGPAPGCCALAADPR